MIKTYHLDVQWSGFHGACVLAGGRTQNQKLVKYVPMVVNATGKGNQTDNDLQGQGGHGWLRSLHAGGLNWEWAWQA